MSSLIQQQAQSAREFLDFYRTVELGMQWSLILLFPLYFLMAWFGFGGLSYAALLLPVGAIALKSHYQKKLRARHLFACECGGITQFSSWVCGFCGKTHTASQGPFQKGPWAKDHTFLESCESEKCNRAQHSILCWHCNEPIILDDDAYRHYPPQSAWHPAHPPEKPAPPGFNDRPPERFTEHLR
jgi:hypothetical protein